MNKEIKKLSNGDFEVVKDKNDIHFECLKIINDFKYKNGSKDKFFCEILGISKTYFSTKINNKQKFNKKDLKKLKLLL